MYSNDKPSTGVTVAMLTAEQAKLLQILSSLDQISAATQELIDEVAESELDTAVRIRSLHTMMGNMIKGGLRQLQAPEPRLSGLD